MAQPSPVGDRLVVDRLSELGLSRLWIGYHDYAGITRGKAVSRDRLEDAAHHGIGWAKANWDFAITDHQVPNPGFAADSGDLRLLPDPATVRPLPNRPGVAVAYGWLHEPDGTPWDGDPRARLAALEETFARRDLSVSVGIEAEFALYRHGTDGRPEPADWGGMFSQAAMDARWSLLTAVLDGLESMGIAVHQLAKEYGPGQYELSLLPTGPVQAVDAWLQSRDLVKSLARDHGLIATFMPKPRDDLAGNGLHLHLSLADAAGTPVLGHGDDPDALSATGLAAVAGLLAHAAGQAGLGSPTPNSYKRLLPGSWAPAHVMWAFGNRAALVRIPSAGAGRHLEYRAGDGAANVYLHLGGLLAAMLDGMDAGALAPQAVAMDVGHLSDAEAAELGAVRLPARLDAALEALEADGVLTGAIGPVITQHYLAVKRFEWESYLAESGMGADDLAVSDWERGVYLEAV